MSTRGDRVVAYARQQVGKPYVFDTAGPDTFDCSGLVLAAYGREGVDLPHSAAEQARLTQRVYQTGLTLQPGDLIFYYQPIDHVSIYVGRDLRGRRMVIAASAPGLGVEYLWIRQYARPVCYGRVRTPYVAAGALKR
jgi:cell wall-associated NlpC family hydrolase